MNILGIIAENKVEKVMFLIFEISLNVMGTDILNTFLRMS
jgi:hypothetical protein